MKIILFLLETCLLCHWNIRKENIITDRRKVFKYYKLWHLTPPLFFLPIIRFWEEIVNNFNLSAWMDILLIDKDDNKTESFRYRHQSTRSGRKWRRLCAPKNLRHSIKISNIFCESFHSLIRNSDWKCTLILFSRQSHEDTSFQSIFEWGHFLQTILGFLPKF